MKCIVCCANGRACSICGYKPPKKKSNYKPKKKEYDCSCSKNQYCRICREEKLKRDGEKKWEEFLEKTWHKLKKYQMQSCGCSDIDFEILNRFGPWIPNQPQIVMILDALKLEKEPV